MNRIKKYTRYFIVFLFSVVLLISLAGIIVINIYGDKIKDYAISSLNEELAVKVEIGNIDLSVFRKFPDVSIVFTNVVAYSSNNFDPLDFSQIQSDTLFKAETIYLRFGLFDLLLGNFKLKRILAENGELSILTDRMGNINYQLWKAKSSREEKELSIDLELFRLNNFKFLIVNLNKDVRASGRTDEITLKGKFGKRKFSLSLMGSLFLETIQREKIIWADNTNIGARISMYAVDSVFTINKGSISLNDLKMETSGSFILGQSLSTDILIEGENLGIKPLVDILPDKLKKRAMVYSPDGRANARIHINGLLSSTQIPSINIEYKVSRGRLKFSGRPDINDISFSGSFSNGIMHTPGTTSFRFSDISARVSKSVLRGNLYIENLVSPYIEADLQGEFHAPDINHFYKDSVAAFTKGIFYPDLKIATKLSSFSDFDIRKIISSNLEGKLNAYETGISFGSKYPEITQLDGEVNILNDIWDSRIEIKSTSGDITFIGRIDHVLKRLIHNSSSLWVQGNIYSQQTDLSFLLNTKGTTSNSSNPFILPEKIFMKLDLSLDNFAMGKFRSTDAKAELIYKPGFLSISSLQLNTMRGSLNGYGGLIQDAGQRMEMKTSVSLKRLDINELFEVFNNFQQDFITSRNLEGRISGTIELSTILRPDLIPDSKTTWSAANISIENGELKDFEPMKNLSRFIEINELEHVTFQTLQNTFIIKDSKVYIPEMDIKSSAFNISASGEHGFNNLFDYNVKVNLSEILANKARRKKENNEFAILEKDGERVNIFLHIWGTPEDYKIRYDRKEAIQQIQRDIITEKKEIKTLLNEELGLFKKQFPDSTNVNPKESPPQFILDWGETDENKMDSSSSKRKKNESEKKSDAYKFDWE